MVMLKWGCRYAFFAKRLLICGCVVAKRMLLCGYYVVVDM